MTSAAASINAERMSYTVLKASFANMDGDQVNDVTLPTNFGDCVLDWVYLECSQILTMVANPELLGPMVSVVDSGLVDIRDTLGVSRWTSPTATSLSAFIQQNWGSVLWRAAERLYIIFREVDTNASPTADLTVIAGVRRLRVSPE